VAIRAAHAVLNGRLRLTDLDLVVFGLRSTSCRQAGPQRPSKEDADSEPDDGAPMPPQYSHGQQATAGAACARLRNAVSMKSAQLCFWTAARGTALRTVDTLLERPANVAACDASTRGFLRFEGRGKPEGSRCLPRRCCCRRQRRPAGGSVRVVFPPVRVVPMPRLRLAFSHFQAHQR
jgi:hypothetical protein